MRRESAAATMAWRTMHMSDDSCGVRVCGFKLIKRGGDPKAKTKTKSRGKLRTEKQPYRLRAFTDNHPSGKSTGLGTQRASAREKQGAGGNSRSFSADAGARRRRTPASADADENSRAVMRAPAMPLGPTHLGFICPRLWWFISKNNHRGSCQFCNPDSDSRAPFRGALSPIK